MLGKFRSARHARGTMLSRPSRLTTSVAAAVLSLAVLPILAVDAQAGPTPPPDCAFGFAETSDACVVPAGITTMTITVIGGGGGGGQASAVVGGGGGGGGEITVCDTVAVTPGDTLTLTVGDGGTGGGLGSGSALAATDGSDSKVVTSGVAGELCKGRGGKAGVAGVGGDSGNGKAGGTGAADGAGGGGGSGSATDDTCGAGANGDTDGGGGGCGQDLFETGASGGGGGGSLTGSGGIANITGSGGNGGGFYTNCVAVSDGQNAHSYGAGGGGGGGASVGGGECLGGTGFKGVVILNFEATPLCDSTFYLGSGECVVPDGVTSMTVVAAGAGGGGGQASGTVAGGGGGGGEPATCEVTVTPGETLTFTVGAGGSGGGAGSGSALAATDGGDTVLTSGSSVELCKALGGKAGIAGTGGASGNSNAGGSGDVVNGGGGGGGGAGDFLGVTNCADNVIPVTGGAGATNGGDGGCGVLVPSVGIGGGGGGGSLSGSGGLGASLTGGNGAGTGCTANGSDAPSPGAAPTYSGGGGGGNTDCGGGTGAPGLLLVQFAPPAGPCVDGGAGYASDDTVTYPVDCVVPDGMTSVDILVVGGGGGGGFGGPAGGGGGGGEVKVCTGVPVVAGDSLTLGVGAGGNGASTDGISVPPAVSSAATDGNNTSVSGGSASLCEALGGLAGADLGEGGQSGSSNPGGNPFVPDGIVGGGGGGGASGYGGDGVDFTTCAGDGGDGQKVSELASPGLFADLTNTYGGGGGGAAVSGCTGGAGGTGGGGAGGYLGLTWGDQLGTAPGGGGGGGAQDFCAPGSGPCGNAGGGFGGYIQLRFSAASKIATTTSTQVSKTVLAQGEKVSDVATVAPDATPPGAPTTDPALAPTGTVSFYYCYDETVAPTTCDDTSGTLISAENLTGSDPYTATLTDWTPAEGVGFYLFNAVYSGDSNYEGSADDGTNEAFEATNLIATTIRLTCPASDDLVRDPDEGGGVVYSGYEQKPCKAYVYAGETKVGRATITYENNTDVGTATASATYDGDATYQAASSEETTFEITPAAKVVVKPVGGKWIVGAPAPTSLYTTSGFKGTDSWSTTGMTPPSCAVYSDSAHTFPVILDTTTLPGTYFVFCKDAVVNGNYQGVSYYRDGTLTVIGLTVTSITPTSGPIAGGTRVRVYGTGFLAGMTVTVGGVPCTSVTVNSYANQIYCVTGAHAAGPADVVVTTPAGSKTLTGSFTYLDASVLTVTRISPTYGSTRGGTKVHIYGTGFTNPISVTIGGVACTRISASYVTSKGGKEVDCYTGRHAAGVVNVVVTTTAGTVTLVGGYRYR